MKKVLVITPTYAENPTSGGVLVTHERIEQLRRVAEVTVLCVHADAAATHSTQVRVIRAGHLKHRSPLVLLGSYLKGQPLSVWRNQTAALMQAAQALALEGWDLIYCDHWLMWPAAQQIKAPKRILHLHNAEHVLFARAAAHLPKVSGMLAGIEATRVRNYLQQICGEADEVHLLSLADEQILKADGVLGDTPTQVFLPSFDRSELGQVNEANTREGLLTVGSMSWEPTRLGMSWFMQEVRPHLKDAPLTVVGKGAPPALHVLFANDRNTKDLGFVESLEPLYQGAKCFIAPLLDGSGIKIKILNALARGLPVVTTPVGVEGFPDGYQAMVRVATTPQEFAAHCKSVLALTPSEWLLTSKAGQAYVQKHFYGSEWAQWCNNL